MWICLFTSMQFRQNDTSKYWKWITLSSASIINWLIVQENWSPAQREHIHPTIMLWGLVERWSLHYVSQWLCSALWLFFNQRMMRMTFFSHSLVLEVPREMSFQTLVPNRQSWPIIIIIIMVVQASNIGWNCFVRYVTCYLRNINTISNNSTTGSSY